VRRILESYGYTVIETGGAAQALEAVRRYEGPIHLILTDVVMPGMGGSELAPRVTELRPDVRVLFMSGYTDDAIVRQGLVAEGGHFLQKPFTPDALAGKVRDVLDREP
jgi:two-component system cell cycle sensor histidine kinase/response regulator CckA